MFYGYYPCYACGFRNDNDVVMLIREAMRDELHDREKYRRMMEMTDDETVKNQIRFAYDDEGKHYKMFQNILFTLTNQTVDEMMPEVEEIPSLLEGVQTSINGELEAVEMYRKIMAMLPSAELKQMLYEIITDEQEHATRFVYLYSMLK